MKRRHSIRMKVVIVPLILVFVTIAVLGAASVYVSYTRTLEQKRLGGLAVAQQVRARLLTGRQARAALEELAAQAEGQSGEEKLSELAELQRELSPEHLVVDVTSGATLSYAAIFDAQGRPEAVSHALTREQLFQDRAKLTALESRTNYVALTEHPLSGEMVWDILLPVFVDEQYTGAVNVGVNLEIVGRTLRSSILFTVLLASSAYLLLSLILILNVSRLIRALAGLGVHVDVLAGKVLHASVPEPILDRKDEVGLVARGIQAMQETLRSVLARVLEAAGATARASQELSASAQQTSATIEEVAGTANQFASTVQTMGGSVAEMVRAAEGIEASASEGQSVVARAVNLSDELKNSLAQLAGAVTGLGESSREIGQIVGAITDIADQTNLLALNAAIEAARAGEHGRGFAVVAEEVRKLAEEAAASSKRITQLVQAIQGEAERTVVGITKSAADAAESASAVARSGELLRLILQQIAEITGTIKEVSRGLELISSGSQELAATTEEQSASMATIASATQELSMMADRLQQLVQEFELEAPPGGKD